jgi:hypothetical protein
MTNNSSQGRQIGQQMTGMGDGQMGESIVQLSKF